MKKVKKKEPKKSSLKASTAGPSGEELFQRGREELGRWPYANHTINETLDVSLIEGRGRQLLYQSLSHETTVAFVGSGISQAYGRLSWSEWLSRQLGKIDILAEAFMKCAAEREKWLNEALQLLQVIAEIIPDFKVILNPNIAALAAKRNATAFRRREVASLYSAFKNTQNSGATVGGEAPPIDFQVAEQLHNILRESAAIVEPTDQSGLDSKDWLVNQSCIMEFDQEADSHISGPYRIRTNFVWDNGITGFRRYFRAALSLEPAKYWFHKSLDRHISSVISKYPDKLSKSIQKYADTLSIFSKLSSRSEAKLDFQQIAKLLLVDDVAHAESLLQEALESLPKNGRMRFEELKESKTFEKDHEKRKKLANILLGKRRTFNVEELRRNRELLGDRSGPESRYSVLGHFKTKSIGLLTDSLEEERLIKNSDPEIQKLWETVNKTVQEINKAQNYDPTYGERSSVERNFISPVHRFVVPMLVGLLEDPLCELATADNDALSFFEEIAPADFGGRRSVIDSELDPLHTMAVPLGIRRFLTTNYDFEIERLYSDRDYIRFTEVGGKNGRGPKRDQMRNDDLGGFFEDGTFTRNRPSDLINFTLDQNGADARIFHLHGRATITSDLVITERDYMNLYLRRDRNRNTVNDAIRLAFHGNPLLFVGLGMEEADVLRPLREFMSDSEPALQRSAIALFAATKSRTDRAKIATTLFLRYGVHLAYYGTGRIESSSARCEISDFDWLYHVDQLIGILIERVEAWYKPLVDLLKERQADSPAIRHLRDNWEHQTLNPFHSEISRSERLTSLKQKMGITEVELNSGKSSLCVLTLLCNAGKTGQKAATIDEIFSCTTIVACAFDGDKSMYGKTKWQKQKDANRTLVSERRILAILIKLDLQGFGSGLQNPNHRKNITKFSDLHSLLKKKPTSKAGKEKWDRLSPKVREAARDGHARLVALQGIRNAILTGALNEALELLAIDWKHWRDRWRAIPPHRLPHFQVEGSQYNTSKDPGAEGEDLLPADLKDDFFGLPLRISRHHVDSVITDFSSAGFGDAPLKRTWIPYATAEETALKEKITGVRSYDNFLAAIQNRTAVDMEPANAFHNRECPLKQGRRVHIVAAQRGQGKGSFMAAFMTPKGLAQYIASSWPEPGAVNCHREWLNRRPPDYLTSLFLNLSFSTEVASNFDGMMDQLIAHLAGLKWIATNWFNRNNTPRVPSKSYSSLLEIAKIGMRTREFETSPNNNSTQAKISDIRRQIHQEISNLPRMKSIRWLIQQCRDQAIHLVEKENLRAEHQGGKPVCPPRFLVVISAAELLFWRRKEPKNREIAEFLTILTDPNLANAPFDLVLITNEQYLGAPVLGRNGTADASAFQGFIPLIRPDTDTAAQMEIDEREQRSPFPMLKNQTALVGSLNRQSRLPKGIDTTQVCGVYFARPVSPTRLVIDNFFPLAAFLHINWWKQKNRNTDEITVVEKTLQKGRATDLIYDLSNTKDSKLITGRGFASKRLQEALMAAVASTAPDNKNALSILWNRFAGPTRDEDADNEWKEIRTVLRGSRFCLTIMLAAAERIALAHRSIEDGANAAEDFIRRTVDDVGSGSRDDRERAVLHHVLDTYESYQLEGDPVSDMELHFALLRHMAVIGTPVSLDVLVRAPRIREYFERHNLVQRQRTRMMLEAMTTITRRGLAFRILPHPRLKHLDKKLQGKEAHDKLLGQRSADKEYRYALHRLVQLYVLRKMGAEPQEFGELNAFAPSLYASMPSDLPRLTFDAHEFLAGLVTHLSQYPEREWAENHAGGVAFAHASISTRVQSLRAAMSIVRSTFSVAVVSHFDDYASDAERAGAQSRPGYFEAYRIQLRWIIRKAWELLDFESDPNFDFRKYKPDQPDGHDRINTVYRDEIVWLYNECGLVCLVQGNLRDAIPLLRQAISINRKIEGGHENGAMHNRISLNLAIALLEIGQLKYAKSRLQRIRVTEMQSGSPDRTIINLVTGYLGLYYHLRGEYEQAQRYYKKALSSLRKISDMRGCSIFSRHLGDLLDNRGRHSKAHGLLKEAAGFAATGGHVDQHNRCKLALLKWEYAEELRVKGYVNAKKQFLQLATIEGYANVMDMPSLLCEAQTHRASLLLNQGETALAGELLISALSLAKRNNMQLRLNSAMTIYALLLRERRSPKEAERMFRQSLSMAKVSENEVEIRRLTAVRSD